MAFCLTLGCSAINAAVVTFDDVVMGETSFGFDGDGDTINDVLFTTTDPSGFNTIGPGANQNFIHEPGLEGTSELSTDLRIDFLNGAIGSITFGFALSSAIADPAYFASIRIFNGAGTEIGSSTVPGAFTMTQNGTSSFPEGVVSAAFSGIAAYALLDFSSQGGRYIIDDFEGTFGSTEPIPDVPEPSTAALMVLGGVGLMLARRAR